jgi:hypothetical protein
MGLYKPSDHAVDESVAPLVQFFELVHIGDTILQMVQVYYDREMVRVSIVTTSLTVDNADSGPFRATTGQVC